VGFDSHPVLSNQYVHAQSGAASGFVNKLVALTVDPPKKRRTVFD
jgi:hypothetical protein